MKILYTLILTIIITTAIYSQNYNDAEYDRGIEINTKEITQSDNNNDKLGNKAIPANDDCSNAIEISVGNALLCGQTTQNASTQNKEYFCNGGGSPETVWYRFTAVNDSTVLTFIETNNSSCSPHVAVYGPFDAGMGCLPKSGSNIVCVEMVTTDRGLHQLVTGLDINKSYLIQIEGRSCGSTRYTEFCIGIANPLVNTISSGASIIDACGTGFNGNTSLGNYPSGSNTWNRNLDYNNATTVSGTSQTGADVTYHINNDSWFCFIPTVDGTWQINIDGISNCHLSGTNGIQASLFVGDPTYLTNIYDFPSPMLPGSSNLSSVITASTGDHIYILIDGWAGDACDYVLTLTNLSGGCNVSPLPINLTSFKATEKDNKVELKWETASEVNNDYFTVLKSLDGKNFQEINTVQGAGNSNQYLTYKVYDYEPINRQVYYKLKQTDFDGRYSYSKLISINSAPINNISDFNVFWNSQDQSIHLNFRGVSEENYSVLISDITGRTIYNSQNLAGNDIETSINIQANDLQKGIYQISLISSNSKESKKILIM